VVEVDGKRLEVVLPEGFSLGAGAGGAPGAVRARAPRRSSRATSAAAVGSDAVVAPMQGTIVKIAVEEGQTVQTGDLLVVLEAMKMEQPITAPKAGVVTGLTAVVGQTVTSGAALLDLKDA
jgi:acetyl-CoA/propionyl-CoA carboxylase, biotin carboxylase, biotin carboxyl carrier protein